MSHKGILIVIVASFFFVIPLLTFPSILHFNEQYIGEGVDSYQFAAFQQLAAKNIREVGWPFANSLVWRYPTGFDFSKSLDGVFHTLTGAAFILVGFNPVVANNISIYLTLLVDVLCTFVLFRYVFKSNLIAYLGSVIYGLSFYTLARGVGHANLMLTGGFPLFIYALLRLKKNQGNFSFLILVISLFLIISSSLLYVAMLGVFMIIGIVLVAIFYKKDIIEYLIIVYSHIVPFFMALSLVGIYFFVLFHSYVFSLLNHTFIFAQNASDYAPSFRDYIIPNQSQYLTIFRLLFVNSKFFIEKSVFLGYVEIILLILGIVRLALKKNIQFIFILSFIFYIFSLGSFNQDLNIFLPYSVLIKTLPFSAIQETGRYYVVFYLFITFIILYFLQSIQQRISRGKFTFLLLFILIFILLERLPYSYFLSENLNGVYIKQVQKSQSKAVLDLPLYDRRYDVLPFAYNRSIVSGYTHWSADNFNAKSFISKIGENRFACKIDEGKSQPVEVLTATKEAELNNSLLDLLYENQTSTIIVHKDFKLYWDNCNNVLKNYSNLFPHVSQLDEAVTNKNFHYRWNSNSLFYSFFFPVDGELILHNIHFLDSEKNQQISIYLNGELLEASDWRSISTYEYSRWTTRYISSDRPIKIKSGDSLFIQGDKFISGQGFFTLNYSFVPKYNSARLEYQWNRLEKIYEDNSAEVWNINY